MPILSQPSWARVRATALASYPSQTKLVGGGIVPFPAVSRVWERMGLVRSSHARISGVRYQLQSSRSRVRALQRVQTPSTTRIRGQIGYVSAARGRLSGTHSVWFASRTRIIRPWAASFGSTFFGMSQFGLGQDRVGEVRMIQPSRARIVGSRRTTVPSQARLSLRYSVPSRSRVLGTFTRLYGSNVRVASHHEHLVPSGAYVWDLMPHSTQGERIIALVTYRIEQEA